MIACGAVPAVEVGWMVVRLRRLALALAVVAGHACVGLGVARPAEAVQPRHPADRAHRGARPHPAATESSWPTAAKQHGRRPVSRTFGLQLEGMRCVGSAWLVAVGGRGRRWLWRADCHAERRPGHVSPGSTQSPVPSLPGSSDPGGEPSAVAAIDPWTFTTGEIRAVQFGTDGTAYVLQLLRGRPVRGLRPGPKRGGEGGLAAGRRGSGVGGGPIVAPGWRRPRPHL